MDLDQHTRHVARALDQRLERNWPARWFSDPLARQLAAQDLVNEIRTATQELLRDQLAALHKRMAESPEVRSTP